jgi:hypothetical protein
MRLFLSVFLVCISFSAGFAAEEKPKGRLRGLVEWCANAAKSAFRAGTGKAAKSGAQSSATVEDVAAYAAGHLPHIGELSATEKSLVQQALGRTSDATDVVTFLHDYSGPRDQLGKVLQWNLDRLGQVAAAPRDAYPVEAWLDLPGFEGVKEDWKRHQKADWKAVLSTDNLKDRQDAIVLSDTKQVAFRNEFNAEPKALTVAEEITHIDSIRDAELNSKAVDGWMRDLIGEVVFEKELARVSQLDRYDYPYQMKHRQKLKTIPDADVRRAIVFLIERDAMMKNLELYRELIKTRPEFRSAFWDDLAKSEYPAHKIASILNQSPRFGLDPKIVDRLDDYTLTEVIHALGGETAAEKDQRDARAALPPPPAPAFIAGKIVNWDLINKLEASDEEANSHKAVDAGVYALQSNRAGARVEDARWFVKASITAATPPRDGKPARDPAAVAKVVNALAESVLLKEFMADSNSAGAMYDIYKASKEMAPENRPSAEALSKMALRYYRINGTPGIAGRQSGTSFMHVSFAAGMAKSTLEYFEAIGDEKQVKLWKPIAEKAEETKRRVLRDEQDRRERRRRN